MAAWVQRVARRVDKTAHDRYRLVGTKERAASGSPLHSQHRCAGVARPEEEAHADEQAERVRRWPPKPSPPQHFDIATPRCGHEASS